MPAETPVVMNILESHAREVAYEVLPSEPREGERGIDFISIVTIIMTIFQTIVQACPKPPADVAKDIRRPTLGQRVALRKKAHEMADSNNSARKIYQAMLNKSSQLTEQDANGLVTSAMNDNNLLV